MKTCVAGFLIIFAWLVGTDQANANRVSQFGIFYNTDYLSSGVGGMFNHGYGTITLTNLTGAVKKAFLYWQGSMIAEGTNGAGNSIVTINNQTIVGTEIGLAGDNCWGPPYNYTLSRAYRADVTSLVQSNGNGQYVLTNFMRSVGTISNAINVNGASLLVFYDDGDPSNNKDVVVLDGNDPNAFSPFPTNSASYDGPGWAVQLSNFRYPGGSASIEFHVSDGQYFEPVDDGPLLFGATSPTFVMAPQGHIFSGDTNYMPSANNGPKGNGCLWDIKSWAIDPYMTNGQSALVASNRFILADCNSLVVAVVVLPVGSVERLSVSGYGERSTHAFELRFNGSSAVGYSVLGSTNLATWDLLGPARELSNGVYNFIDAENPRPPRRYYQIRSP